MAKILELDVVDEVVGDHVVDDLQGQRDDIKFLLRRSTR